MLADTTQRAWHLGRETSGQDAAMPKSQQCNMLQALMTPEPSHGGSEVGELAA